MRLERLVQLERDARGRNGRVHDEEPVPAGHGPRSAACRVDCEQPRLRQEGELHDIPYWRHAEEVTPARWCKHAVDCARREHFRELVDELDGELGVALRRQVLTFASESERRHAARLCRPRPDGIRDEEVRVGAAVDLHAHHRLASVLLHRRVDLELDAADVVAPSVEEALVCLLDLRGAYGAQRRGRSKRLALRVCPQLAVSDFDRVHALLGLVDALDVLVDGAHEAVRHSVQHKRVRALGEADEACQDCRGHIVDCRRCARRLGAEVDHDVEVVRLEHRALELDRFVALVADLD